MGNTVYVIGANQIDNICSGFNMNYDPMGVQYANGGEESLVTSTIDVDRINRVKRKLPVLDNPRAELYKNGIG